MSGEAAAVDTTTAPFAQLVGRLSAAGVRHAVLRDTRLDGALKDLDILVWPEGRQAFQRVAADAGFKPLRRPAGRLKEVLGTSDGRRLLVIDVHYALVQDGLVYLPLDGVATRARHDAGFATLGPEDLLLHLFFHSMLGKGGLQAKHLTLVEGLLREALDASLLLPRVPAAVRPVLSRFLADPAAFTQGHPTATSAAAEVRAAIERAPGARPSGAADGRAGWRRRGVHVAFMGVDGAGKSTVIEATRQHLAAWVPLTVRDVYMGPWGHMRSPFMRAYKAAGLGVSDEDWPGRLREAIERRQLANAVRAARKTVTSTAQGWLYYLAVSLELWYRYLREVRPVVRRGGIVLSDRYVYDLRHIYKTRRATRFEWPRRLACRLFPAPDVVCFVQNAPDVIAARKAQLSASAVEEFQALYTQALAGHDTIPVVTDRPADVLASEITGEILRRYLRD